MKDLVRIKSLSKGLAIQLNQEAEFDDILNLILFGNKYDMISILFRV